MGGGDELMPFRSEAQRKYLYANHPEIAARFASDTPKDAILPEHVSSSFRHTMRTVASSMGKRRKRK